VDSVGESRRERVGRISTLEGERRKGRGLQRKGREKGEHVLQLKAASRRRNRDAIWLVAAGGPKSGSMSCRAELMPKARTVGDAAHAPDKHNSIYFVRREVSLEEDTLEYY
jgi:hypothetical protein